MRLSRANPEAVREAVLAALNKDLACEVLEDDTGRVGCLTPFEYPDGDAVVVWVREMGDKMEVSDYGE